MSNAQKSAWARVWSRQSVPNLLRGLLALLTLAGLIWLGLRWLRGNSCVLALRGTNATLSVEGWRAQEECARILGESGMAVSQWPGLVRVQAPYVPRILCQQVDGLTSYTVHGQPAAYSGIGWQLCSMRQAQPFYPGDFPPDQDAIDFYPR